MTYYCHFDKSIDALYAITLMELVHASDKVTPYRHSEHTDGYDSNCKLMIYIGIIPDESILANKDLEVIVIDNHYGNGDKLQRLVDTHSTLQVYYSDTVSLSSLAANYVEKKTNSSISDTVILDCINWIEEKPFENIVSELKSFDTHMLPLVAISQINYYSKLVATDYRSFSKSLSRLDDTNFTPLVKQITAFDLYLKEMSTLYTAVSKSVLLKATMNGTPIIIVSFTKQPDNNTLLKYTSAFIMAIYNVKFVCYANYFKNTLLCHGTDVAKVFGKHVNVDSWKDTVLIAAKYTELFTDVEDVEMKIEFSIRANMLNEFRKVVETSVDIHKYSVISDAIIKQEIHVRSHAQKHNIGYDKALRQLTGDDTDMELAPASTDKKTLEKFITRNYAPIAEIAKAFFPAHFPSTDEHIISKEVMQRGKEAWLKNKEIRKAFNTSSISDQTSARMWLVGTLRFFLVWSTTQMSDKHGMHEHLRQHTMNADQKIIDMHKSAVTEYMWDVWRLRKSGKEVDDAEIAENISRILGNDSTDSIVAKLVADINEKVNDYLTQKLKLTEAGFERAAAKVLMHPGREEEQIRRILSEYNALEDRLMAETLKYYIQRVVQQPVRRQATTRSGAVPIPTVRTETRSSTSSRARKPAKQLVDFDVDDI